MIIKQNDDFVELTVGEVVPADRPGAGDVRATLDVACEGFTGRTDQVWIERDELAGFLAELRDLAQTGQGAAELTSMSPGELRLRVFALDQAGHLAVEGEIARLTYRDPALREMRLGFSFGLASEQLPGIVRELETMTPRPTPAG